MEGHPPYTQLGLQTKATLSASSTAAQPDSVYLFSFSITYRIVSRIDGDLGQQACGIFEVVEEAMGVVERQEEVEKEQETEEQKTKEKEPAEEDKKKMAKEEEQGEGREEDGKKKQSKDEEKRNTKQEDMQRWALKLFLREQYDSFKQEKERFEHIQELKEGGKGRFPCIIQAKEIFEDLATGMGCIVMPLAKESLKKRM
jgi:hypothetical protein